ncbi:MAG: hypothetical protein ABSC62_03515 [Terracidiphilus sp.]|jgi:transposase
MGFIQGEGRSQGTLFPVVLDDLVPDNPVCRAIDAFVGRLEMNELGFVRAEAAETGRPGYDPRDLLKLYLMDTCSRFGPHGAWRRSAVETWK